MLVHAWAIIVSIFSFAGTVLGIVNIISNLNSKKTRLHIETALSEPTQVTTGYAGERQFHYMLPVSVTFKVTNKSEFEVNIEKISVYGTNGASWDSRNRSPDDLHVIKIAARDSKKFERYFSDFSEYVLKYPSNKAKGLIFTATNGSQTRVKNGPLIEALNNFSSEDTASSSEE